MKITEIHPQQNYCLKVITDDGRIGIFDVSPYLTSEVFSELKNSDNFNDLFNGEYFIEWGCGADLSADTIEAHMRLI